METFVESNDSDPLLEQFGFTGDMHLVLQQVTASSSNSSEIERHSLNNTASSNSHGGLVRRRLYSLYNLLLDISCILQYGIEVTLFLQQETDSSAYPGLVG